MKWDYGFSRQRHFGIPIPVWYGKKTGNIYYANESQLPCDPTTCKPLIKQKKAIIFDFDGVIFDSINFHIKKTNELFDIKVTRKDFENWLLKNFFENEKDEKFKR